MIFVFRPFQRIRLLCAIRRQRYLLFFVQHLSMHKPRCWYLVPSRITQINLYIDDGVCIFCFRKWRRAYWIARQGGTDTLLRGDWGYDVARESILCSSISEQYVHCDATSRCVELFPISMCLRACFRAIWDDCNKSLGNPGPRYYLTNKKDIENPCQDRSKILWKAL